jgi:hypothetical protein
MSRDPAYFAERAALRRAEGLCLRCPEQARPGKNTCVECYEDRQRRDGHRPRVGSVAARLADRIPNPWSLARVVELDPIPGAIASFELTTDERWKR